MFPFSFIIKFNFHILYITLRKIINYIKKNIHRSKNGAGGKQEKKIDKQISTKNHISIYVFVLNLN